MGTGKKWKPEEETYLAENWCHVSVPKICKRLGCSRNAIMIRANRMGLPPFFDGGDYVTLHQLVIALGYSKGADQYKLTSWVENRGFPVKVKRHTTQKVRVVYLEDFWKWAEENRSFFLDFSRMEPLALGAEPAWVAEQRKKDAKSFKVQRKDPWTPGEDHRLQMLLKEHKYGYKELSAILARSEGAILRRCRDLGIKERPVPMPKRGEDAVWTDADFETVAQGIRNGDSYATIGNAIGKSEKAIRGRVYSVYFTERADKVRAMMGSGTWGTGAPVPTVKQARHLSRTKPETMQLLERLAGVLRYRTLEMKTDDYDRYFQRAMCMNWDDLQHICTAGGEDCDACADFQRIRPQYCVRCGGTFFERKENKCCTACRVARKRQAARKWRKLNEPSKPY